MTALSHEVSLAAMSCPSNVENLNLSIRICPEVHSWAMLCQVLLRRVHISTVSMRQHYPLHVMADTSNHFDDLASWNDEWLENLYKPPVRDSNITFLSYIDWRWFRFSCSRYFSQRQVSKALLQFLTMQSVRIEPDYLMPTLENKHFAFAYLQVHWNSFHISVALYAPDCSSCDYNNGIGYVKSYSICAGYFVVSSCCWETLKQS